MFPSNMYMYLFYIIAEVPYIHVPVCGVKQSEEANMLEISTGLPRPPLRTLEAPEVATQGEYRLPPAI